jgi:hypothetical protein
MVMHEYQANCSFVREPSRTSIRAHVVMLEKSYYDTRHYGIGQAHAASEDLAESAACQYSICSEYTEMCFKPK